MEILRRLWNEETLTEDDVVVKQALFILAGLIVLCIGVAAIYFDGAAKPYGRPGKLPEPTNQYQIYKERQIVSETECSLELYYNAPSGVEIEYVLKDAEGKCIATGVETNDGKAGKITLVLKKPEVGKSYTINFESSCKKIKLGQEKLDKPKLVGTSNCSYTLTCGQDGYVDFEKRLTK